jgi:hypothetical protein
MYSPRTWVEISARMVRVIHATENGSIVIGEAHRLDRGLWSANAADWPHDWPQFTGDTYGEVANALRLAVYMRSALASESA